MRRFLLPGREDIPVFGRLRHAIHTEGSPRRDSAGACSLALAVDYHPPPLSAERRGCHLILCRGRRPCLRRKTEVAGDETRRRTPRPLRASSKRAVFDGEFRPDPLRGPEYIPGSQAFRRAEFPQDQASQKDPLPRGEDPERPRRSGRRRKPKRGSQGRLALTVYAGSSRPGSSARASSCDRPRTRPIGRDSYIPIGSVTSPASTASSRCTFTLRVPPRREVMGETRLAGGWGGSPLVDNSRSCLAAVS